MVETRLHRNGLEAADRAARGHAEALDQRFGAIQRGQPPLYVMKPSQVGVGWFLAQRALGVFQLSI